MKKLATMLILFMVVLCSCEKEQSISEQLMGTWELRTEINGTTGQKKDFPINNGNTIQFNFPSYEIYREGVLVKKGSYELSRAESMLRKEVLDRILFDHDQDLKTFVVFSGNEIELFVDAYDSSSSIYSKK